MKDVTTSFNLFLDFETKEERIEKLKNTLPHYENAESDNQKLCNFQYDFLVNGDRKAEAMLWNGFYTLCIKAVRKEKSLKRIFMDFEEVEIKAGIACDYVMRRYSEWKKNDDKVYVIINFIAAAYEAMRHAVYHEEENDFILDKCKTLNGKPLAALKEVDLSIPFNAESCPGKSKRSETDPQTLDLPGQLFLF